MSTQNALQLPIIVDAGGESVAFPRWEMQECLQWAAEVAAARQLKAENKAKANSSLSPFERERISQIAGNDEIELNLLMLRARTPQGITKVLMTSLTKAGKNAADAKAILSRIHFLDQQDLAMRLMSPPDPVKEESPPLSESPSGDGEPTTG